MCPTSLEVFTLITLDTPKGIRIPVASVKGRCPRPLDDGGLFFRTFISVESVPVSVKSLGITEPYPY